MIDAQIQAQNKMVLDGLMSKESSLQKEASNGVNDYLRIRAREDGFARRILPPVAVSATDFDRQVDTVKPVIVKDMEPNSPRAISVPFGTAPLNTYVDAPRYRVTFDRIMSQRFTADVANLLTYDMDIRQIFNDLMLKDILGEEDRKFMASVQRGVSGGQSAAGTGTAANNTRVDDTGAFGWIEQGALSRVTLAHAMKGLPSTDQHLTPAVALVNNITIWDIVTLDRAAVGGDLAQEMFLEGFTERKIMGVTWYVTIKTDLVLEDSVYFFASPKFLGDFYTFDDVTVSTKHENFHFEMFAYEMIGASLRNTAAMARVDFNGNGSHDWRVTAQTPAEPGDLV